MNTSNINLLGIIQQDVSLKRVANTGGGEWHGPCPFCGGKDRFVVHPEGKQGGHFWCRQCRQSGDAIEYVQKRRNLSFHEACKHLHLETPERSQFTPKSNFQFTDSSVMATVWNATALCDPEWQKKAKQFCRMALDTLWSSSGKPAREFLYQRGFNDTTIKAAWLGFNPSFVHEDWGKTEIKLGAGIVIPWLYDKQLWSVKLRRLDNNTPKYSQAKGGANGLYRADAITSDSVIVLVEGELDALSISQSVGTEYVSLATGSSSGARRIHWLMKLRRAKEVILAFDNDPAGEEVSLWWSEYLTKMCVKHCRLKPNQKDANEMMMLGESIPQWLSQSR